MTPVIEFLSSNIAADLSVALLHTLWQGLFITAALYLTLKAIPSNRPQWRYRLSIVSLLLIVLCFLATFSILQYQPPQKSQNDPLAANTIARADTTAISENFKPVATVKPPETAAQPAANIIDTESVNIGVGNLIVVWSVGVFIMLVRMFRALASTARLRSSAVDIEDGPVKELFDKLCRQMDITQKIRFASTMVLKHPGVIGFFRPVLLVPVSMLTELPADYLQAIIAHELAHIRRYDYLVNFCQMLIEAIFFFNPAVWWVSRRIRIEREVCCDSAGIETTGKPIQYAKILFDQLTRSAQTSQTEMTAAITGFSDEKSSTSAERVKRIIHPNHKPQMRIGWIKLALLIAIASLSILALWKAADTTVNLAAKMLTPKQRIEKMAELEKSHGLPEYDPERTGLNEDEKVTVAGTIKTWDGKKVERYDHMSIHYSRHQSSGTIGISPSYGSGSWDGSAGTFSHRCSYGAIYVSASSMNYAPAIAGPFKLGPGEKKEDIELILEKGYPATIRVIDADSQKPVEDVELIGGYLFRPDGYSHNINLNTNEEGIAVLEHAGDFNVTLNARCQGYQTTLFKDISLVKDGVLLLKMKKSEPAEGVVISKKTGNPVEGAVIKIQHTQHTKDNSTNTRSRDQGDALATTDENGTFVLDQLSEELKYVFSIKADGYAYAFEDQITPGKKNIRIELKEPIIIKGRVTGPIDRLPEKNGKPYVPYSCSFSWNHHSSSGMAQEAFVTINGDEGTFELNDLWGTSVKVGMKHWKKSIKLDEDVPEKIVLDLSDPVTEDGKKYQKRQLVIEFDTPEGFPPPTGTVRLDYIDPAYALNSYKPKLAKIKDGKVQAEIVAPGKIGYRMADTVGYWFKEKSEIKVDDKDEPLVIKVPVIPAGMIFGEVFEADGTPAVNTMVGYNVIKKSPLLDKDVHILNVDGKNSSSSAEMETRYSVSPLPLEGVYCVIAYRKSTYVISDEIKLTEKDPIQQVNLKLPDGVTLSGRILLPDGTPAHRINYKLHFNADAGKGFSDQGDYTDIQGRFKIEHVNPDTGGTYRLEIENDRDYRPVQMELENLKKPIEIKLEKGAIATGRIVDKETGWPIPSVEVSAFYHNYKDGKSDYEQVKPEAKTDKNGRFRFSNLKPGREYNLAIISCQSDSYTIVGGKTKDEVFKATLSKWSKLKPRKPDTED